MIFLKRFKRYVSCHYKYSHRSQLNINKRKVGYNVSFDHRENLNHFGIRKNGYYCMDGINIVSIQCSICYKKSINITLSICYDPDKMVESDIVMYTDIAGSDYQSRNITSQMLVNNNINYTNLLNMIKNTNSRVCIIKFI